MKAFFKRFFEVLTPGVAWVLMTILLGYVLSRCGAIPLLWIVPSDVMKGHVWRLVTHAFVPTSFFELIFNGLFIVMIGYWLGRVWSCRELYLFCVLSALATGVVKMALGFWDNRGLFGTLPLTFGLLVAWARMFGHEKVLFMMLWEMSIWQVAVLIAILDIIMMAGCPCFGWANLLAVCGASAASWLFLSLRWKRNLGYESRPQSNQRIHRLEM
ncbi:MAG TPA: rhomboid family intramembrane serine protease [Candidatus Paceibacterota bacterium]|nr:rhomboid family intramembrane serine protease [Verrucomicrobiota bacterium]HRY46754.1 rhomboid family intramembrane serine protease [Candidatus Paceibacterota bacterium]HSA01107.1 rhomboid family intramembrane serine protease [Candidatus Paceibacterota bacterium]